MQVGRMRYRIEIQDYKSTQDADGFETREWMTVHTVWATSLPFPVKSIWLPTKRLQKSQIKYTSDFVQALNLP